MLDKLNRKYGRRFGIPNLMIYITATMLAVFMLDTLLRVNLSSYLVFYRDWILSGQIWRLVTFIFLPPSSSNVLFMIISLYFYYFIGNSLENVWGSFQFTVYYLCGVLGAIVAGFLTGYATNAYLNLSLFFAFAHLFPNHQVLLFFIIPIKIKYLAYLNWFYFLVSFVSGTMWQRAAILFSLINFFLFFGKDIYYGTRNKINTYRRRRQYKKNGGDSFWR